MGDENGTYGSPGGGNAGEGTPPASPEEVSGADGSQPKTPEQLANENQYVTQEELKSWKDDTLRSVQSMTDKAVSRMDKEIQAAIEQANQSIQLVESTGNKLTPAQADAIRQKAINEAYAKRGSQEPSTEDSQQETKAADQGPNPEAAYVQNQVQRIMNETGVYIHPEEANKLILGEKGENKMDSFQFIKAFESLAKQRQLNRSQSQGPNPNIPSMVSGGNSPAALTALRQQYDRERAQIRNGTHPQIRRGDISGIQRLEIAYRNKGLDI